MAARLKLARRINLGVAGVVSSVIFYNKIANVENRKQALQLKIDNEPVPVPASIKNLLEEIRRDINDDTIKNSKYDLFISKGVDITQLGIPDFFGVQIGIPYNFLFDKDSEIDLNVMMDENGSLTDTEDMETLKESMCLSKEAKKFALAHEIYKSHFSTLFSCGLLPLLTVVNFNILSYMFEKLSKKQNLPTPPKHHLGLYFFGAWAYILVYDALTLYRDYDSDHMTSQLGDSYIRGGIEYYQKMIKRNKILKKVQKSSHFTEDGEIETPTFRATHLPFISRISSLRDYASENFSAG